ncbi:MAG TPA: FIST C-terminal domain-containing protein [Acidiferrobacteraceae bacterium]|nr:FIST C-terminal domain-containing protein [Acidiferrobacteraceae bacterium]
MNVPIAATGLSHGARAHPEHAAVAVRRALERAGWSRAQSVLLFLTPHYARHPEAAIRAAARAAGSLQVYGATGAGILTEQEWLLDAPGAAAMVFSAPLLPASMQPGEPLLSLSTPAGLTSDWLDAPPARIGAVSGDLFGQGPFQVWAGARVAETGRVEAGWPDMEWAIRASQGVRALTAPIEVGEVAGLDLLRLGNYPALNVLVQALPVGVREMERIPLHLIMGGVTFGDPLTAIREGRYRLNHIVATHVATQSITLSQPLQPGERLFWAMRDILTAERDMRVAIDAAADALSGTPGFGLLFPCMGRGPHFFGNRDRDLELVQARLPGLPVLGMYGNGEIGPLQDENHLYQYSTVLGLFRARTAC